MSKEKIIKTTDWLTRGIPKEQLEREKREAIMSADLEVCMSFDVWAERETGEKTVDYDYVAEKMVAKGYCKQNDWISVKDRFPEDGKLVVTYSMSTEKIGSSDCLKSYVEEYGNYGEVTHWLPMPELPTNK